MFQVRVAPVQYEALVACALLRLKDSANGMNKELQMNNKKILFVDDEEAGRRVALFNLREAGYVVDEAANGEIALGMFSPEQYQLVITDVRMPGLSGIDLLQEIRKRTTEVPVLVITAYAKIDTAVEAMKLGAFDFIVKPFNKDQLFLAVEKAFTFRKLREENRNLKIQVKGIQRPIIFRSEKMKETLAVVDRVAPSEAPVLITGESGTGKELIARRLHVKSPRAEGPFVPINCAALPSELLESELFGYSKGAFTGAVKDRLGRFRQANGGTIFLDEIGELPAPLQAKLLRVLQEHVIFVLGKDESTPVNVRIVSATNKNLEELVKEKTFREDLLYRLNVVHINVPPLREHAEDIKPLVEHFIRNFGDDRELLIPKELVELLQKYQWPGNVRELENVCQRLALLCQGSEVCSTDLPPELIASVRGEPLRDENGAKLFDLPDEGLSLIDLEKNIILRVLESKSWNVSKSATYLGVPRHVLAYRMEKYGISKK